MAPKYGGSICTQSLGSDTFGPKCLALDAMQAGTSWYSRTILVALCSWLFSLAVGEMKKLPALTLKLGRRLEL